jgi:hypothetical protein
MTRPDDPGGDMTRFPSDHDADRLLAGQLSPEDLPDEAAALATLLSTMRGHVAAGDAEADRRAISTLAADIRDPGLASASGVSHIRSRRGPARASALAFAAVLMTGTAAAAATGSLPGPVQGAIARTLSHVAISLPDPDHDGSNGAAESGGANHAPGQADRGRGSVAPSGPAGPDAGGAAKYGLCTAAAQNPPATANGRRSDSVAFSNLERAATDAGMSTTEFCRGVTPGAGNGTAGPTGGPPNGSTGSGGEATTTAPHGPPTSIPGNGQGPTGPTGHTPTTEPPQPTGATGAGNGDHGGTTPGTAHQPSQADAGS